MQAFTRVSPALAARPDYCHGYFTYRCIHSRTMLIEVHLACNDYRDGSPTGKTTGLEILAQGDIALSLDPVTGDGGPVCRITDRSLTLGRHRYPVRRHSTWVGSWCWDSVLVDLPVAARLLDDARASKWWSPDSGWSSMWERWESDAPFNVEFLQAELG